MIAVQTDLKLESNGSTVFFIDLFLKEKRESSSKNPFRLHFICFSCWWRTHGKSVTKHSWKWWRESSPQGSLILCNSLVDDIEWNRTITWQSGVYVSSFDLMETLIMTGRGSHDVKWMYSLRTSDPVLRSRWENSRLHLRDKTWDDWQAVGSDITLHLTWKELYQVRLEIF